MEHDNKGMTLVEVVVGFVLLTIIVTSFIKIIKLSSEMTKNSVDILNRNVSFEEKYYDGKNYSVGNKNAFKDTSTPTISIIEIREFYKQTDGDYFEQWHPDENGVFQPVSGNLGTSFVLPGVHLYTIENVNDTNVAKTRIFKYYKSETTEVSAD